MPWCAQLPPGCLVAMETSSSAHHWARRLTALGLDARLIAGHFVSPYRMNGRSGKNDAADAAAICEAASRPTMRFVPIKTPDQQAVLSLHLLREGYKEERIAEHVRRDSRAKAAKQLSGIGPITASAMVASVGDFKQFKNAGQFGAWLGLVPRQNSSGGKNVLGRITKRGDDYLRTLLIQGAKSAVLTAHKRTDRISVSVTQLKARVGWQKAVVALANKNARILWAVLSRSVTFDADHVPVKPQGPLLTPTPPCPA
jgi:transposase